jgi:hypothetical protein
MARRTVKVRRGRRREAQPETQEVSHEVPSDAQVAKQVKRTAIKYDPSLLDIPAFLKREDKNRIRNEVVSHGLFRERPKPGSELTESQVGDAYAHYNYYYDVTVGRVFLEYYFNGKGKEPDLAHILPRIPDQKINLIMCWIADMKDRDCKLPKSTEVWWAKELAKLKATADEIAKEPEKARETRWRLPDHWKDRPIATELHGLVDDFVLGGCKTPPVEDWQAWFSQRSTNGEQLASTKAYYEACVAELQSISSDDQLKEAYKGRSKKEIASLLALYEGILAGMGTAATNTKRERRTRRSRLAGVERTVRRAKVAERDETTGLTSLAPEKVIGKEIAYLYDKRRRRLRCYVAEAGKTLTFNRSSIANYDPAKSLEKKVRQPAITVLDVAKSARKMCEKIFADLNTKPRAVRSARTSDKILIVAVF